MTKWICRRCKAFVVETKDGKRCECTISPSPWEVVEHEHTWFLNGEICEGLPPSYGEECVCGEKRMVRQWSWN